MRAVTLADSKVRSALNRDFVCGWTNIEGKTDYAGSSNKHQPSNAAIKVNTCSGHHNVQTFLMTADGKVVHCLPGFWPAKAYVSQLGLAKKLDTIYRNEKRPARRNEKFLDLHLQHAAKASRAAKTAELQGFDKRHIERTGNADFERERGPLTGKLKSADQVMHERMAERPYLSFESFDTKAFIDMGVRHYAYHHGLDRKKKRAKRDKKKKRDRVVPILTD